MDVVFRVCRSCVKPDPRFFKLPIKSFVGKYVKLGFPTGLENPGIEHMWVLVSGRPTFEDHIQHIAETGENFELVGILNNNPIYVEDLANGSVILFNRNEVEDVLAEPDGPSENER